MAKRVIVLMAVMFFTSSTVVEMVLAQESKVVNESRGGQEFKRPSKQRRDATRGESTPRNSTPRNSTPRNSTRGKRLPEVTPEREATVLTFVKRHHPELGQLLRYLRSHQPRQYQRAVRELARMAERLAQVHERDVARYELELSAWKTRSHIDLLAARMQMEPSAELRAELRAALIEQAKTRKRLLQGERARLVKRIEKLDAQIEQIESYQDRDVEARLQVLTSGTRRRGAAKSRDGKNRDGRSSGSRSSGSRNRGQQKSTDAKPSRKRDGR